MMKANSMFIVALVLLSGCWRTEGQADEGGTDPPAKTADGSSGGDSDTDADTDTDTYADTDTDTYADTETDSGTENGEDSHLVLEWVVRAGTDVWAEWGEIASSDSPFTASGNFSDVGIFGQGDDAVEMDARYGWGSFFVASYSSSGTLRWVEQAGGEWDTESGGVENGILDAAAFDDGSSFATGMFGSAVNFGEGDDAVELDTQSTSAFFLAKYGANGAFQWVAQADDASGWSAAGLADGTLLAAGYFAESATFGNGEDAVTLSAPPYRPGTFIVGYAPDGTLEWASGPDWWLDDELFYSVYPGHLGALPDGSSYLAGTYTKWDGYKGWSTDMFVAKLNDTGQPLWMETAGNRYTIEPGEEDHDWIHGLAAHPDGSVLVTGAFSGEATFGQGSDARVLVSVTSEEDPSPMRSPPDAFVARYGVGGDLLWAAQAGGEGSDSGSAVSVMTDGTTIVSVAIGQAADFGEGLGKTTVSGDEAMGPVVACYDDDGAFMWVEQPLAGDPAGDPASFSYTVRVADDAVYLLGNISDTTTFGSGSSAVTLSPLGDTDLFIARFNIE